MATSTGCCSICLEEAPKDPVPLPCGHSFCEACLDGWRDKFSAEAMKLMKRKCPVCRAELPPTKEMADALRIYEKDLERFEAAGDTSSAVYLNAKGTVEEYREIFKRWEGTDLKFKEDDFIQIPNEIFTAARMGNNRKVVDWIGLPPDRKRLEGRYGEEDDVNMSLLHLASLTDNRDLMHYVLQSGLDVNTLNKLGYTALLFKLSGQPMMFGKDSAMLTFRLLTEWGLDYDAGPDDREWCIEGSLMKGMPELARMIKSDFGGRRCELQNMKTGGMNGRVVLVEKLIESKQRYKIEFEDSGDKALVRADNLKRRDRTPLDAGYYVEFTSKGVVKHTFKTKEECQAYASQLMEQQGISAQFSSRLKLDESSTPKSKGGKKKKGKKGRK